MTRLVIVADYERSGPNGGDDKLFRQLFFALDPARVIRKRCRTISALLAEVDRFQPDTEHASITLIGHGSPGQFLLRTEATSAHGICYGTADGDRWLDELAIRLPGKIRGHGTLSLWGCRIGRGDGHAMIVRLAEVCPTSATLAGFDLADMNADGTLAPGVSTIDAAPGVPPSYPNGYCGWPAGTR